MAETWELFGQYMSGAHAGLCCVISSESLSEAAEKALDSSLAALGYGHDACTFVAPGDLDQQALFVLIEGLDPICIVAADGKAPRSSGKRITLPFPPGRQPACLAAPPYPS